MRGERRERDHWRIYIYIYAETVKLSGCVGKRCLRDGAREWDVYRESETERLWVKVR